MLHLAIFYASLLLACFYALSRGGGPERWVAGIMLAGVAATQMTLPASSDRYGHLEAATFAIDLLVLGGFLAVALRANRQWPLIVTVLHLMSVAAHLARSMEPEMIRVVYKALIAVWVYPQLALLAVGTARHQRRRRLLGADPSWSTSSPLSSAPTVPSSRGD